MTWPSASAKIAKLTGNSSRGGCGGCGGTTRASRGCHPALATMTTSTNNNQEGYNLQILGSQKETSGVAALALLCVIVLSSLRVVRRVFYEGFWVLHVVGYVGFFVTVCYHTVYAAPWIFPPLAFYGVDVMLRLGRFRIKDASLSAVDQNMTIVRTLLYHHLLSYISCFLFCCFAVY